MRSNPAKNKVTYAMRCNVCLAMVICMIFLGFAGTSSASDKGSANLNGIYHSRGVDDNANGLMDHIDVDVGIDVKVPGNYKVLGSLYDDGGNETMLVTERRHLPFGLKFITLQFYGLRQPGAFHLRNITLYDDKGLILDRRDDAYTTERYFSLDPGPQLAKLTGKYEDQGIDVNSDGKYESLAVDIGTKIYFPGQYTLTGYLYDKKGSEIGWAIDNGIFEPGDRTMRLDFDGMPIERHGVDGPYTLDKLFLTGKNLQVKDTANCAYNTSAYNYSDFTAYNGSNKEKLISGNGYGELLLTVAIHCIVPVSSGIYSYDLEGINIPPISTPLQVTSSRQGYSYNLSGIYLPNKPNNFTVSARGVKNLNVGLKKLQGSYENSSAIWKGKYTRIWVTTQVDADKNGRATTGSDLLSPGNYHAKIFGEARENASEVDLTMTVIKKMIVNGRFDLRINTTGFPEGDYSFKVKALNGTFNLDEISLDG